MECKFKTKLIHKSVIRIQDSTDTIGNIISTEEIEDFLGFDFQTFQNYCLYFVKSYNEQIPSRCSAAINLIIQFFDDVSDLFQNNTIDVSFFIHTFESTNFSSMLFRILEDETNELYRSAISFFSMLSSLHTPFIEWMLRCSDFFSNLPHIFLTSTDQFVCGSTLILFHNILPIIVSSGISVFSGFHQLSDFLQKAHEFSDSPILISEIIFLLSKFTNATGEVSSALVEHVSLTLTQQTLRFSVCSLMFLLHNDESVLDSVLDMIPSINRFSMNNANSEYFSSYFGLLRIVVSKCDSMKKEILVHSLNFSEMKSHFHSENSLIVSSVCSFACACIPEFFDIIDYIFVDINEFAAFLINLIQNSSFKEKEIYVSLLSDVILYFSDLDITFSDEFLEEIFDIVSFSEGTFLSKVLNLLILIHRTRNVFSYSIFTSSEFVTLVEELANTKSGETSILARQLIDEIYMNNQ